MPDIKLRYKGAEYTIPEDRAFQIGERVEQIATLGEISAWQARPQYHRMARCIGEVLRFAGCKTSDREVMAELMASLKSTDVDFLGAVLVALIGVLTDGMLIEPNADDAPSGEIDPS
jgi:hypothetical protein